ncbi:HAD-like domain-containing protein [Aspergillus cavernicola]|uniref:HAD-like domain-containing protein n=1 Tax=Aspergillus cavernicola TaxID=176166 RepID=A0ABR4IDA6_9EURO
MPPPTPSLIIFDFDGTLFNTHTSIQQTITLTFRSLLKSHPLPNESAIKSQIGSGAGLADTFRSLYPTPETFTPEIEELWIAKYRELYAAHGQGLIEAYPGARELLENLVRKGGVVVAIISNKGVEAVQTALKNNELDGYFTPGLIIGDKTPGAKRKPDPAAFRDVLVPRLREVGVEISGDGEGVVVVGDTVADIEFARNIGARSCWCRFGYGDRVQCEGLGPDLVVDGLGEVGRVLEE